MTQPDHDALMAQVRVYADAARKTSEGVEVTQEKTTNSGVIAPIHMGANAHDVIPERYVVHFSITKCANCGTESRDNEFYALRYIRSRVNGSRVRNLVRCDRPLYNLPIDVIPTGSHRVPFCCECTSFDLSHLPPPPEPAKLHDMPDVSLKGQKRTTPKEPKTPAAPPKKSNSLDDLI